MESTLNNADTEAAWQQIAPQLETAMDTLSERDRNAVVLRFFENQTLAQVGAALPPAARTGRLAGDPSRSGESAFELTRWPEKASHLRSQRTAHSAP